MPVCLTRGYALHTMETKPQSHYTIVPAPLGIEPNMNRVTIRQPTKTGHGSKEIDSDTEEEMQQTTTRFDLSA